MNKVYIVVETSKWFEREFSSILSVHESRENAVRRIEKEHDDTIDEFIGNDDNNLSRISADEHWDGTSCSVMNDGGLEIVWTIAEREVVP